MSYVPTSKFTTNTVTVTLQHWLNYLVGYLLLCVTLVLGNSAQAQVFASLQATGGTVPASATTFNAGIRGNVQVGQYGDAINGVELFIEGNSTPLAYKYYVVSYDKLERPIDTQRSFDLSAALPPGTYRLYVTASSENGLSANSPVYTVTVSPNTTVVAAALNAIFSILLDDDSGTSTPPSSGGTGGSGGAGGTGETGGAGGSTADTGGTAPVSLATVSIAELNYEDAGTLPGNLSVGKDGTVSYGVELSVPPGTAGMQPKLALNYNSAGGAGISGLGWSLGGASSVHRCAKTMAQDGVNDRVTFTSADRLCLDGNRLVKVNGNNPGSDLAARDAAYWDYSAVYRTELESFSRVTRWGGGFKVENKDGTVQYYGTTGDSAAQAQGRGDGQPMQWMLARLEDRSGNYLNWEYNNDAASGEVTPKQIRYGGNTNNGQTADLAVRFAYEPRTDVQVAFIGGSHSDVVSRLTSVKTFIGTDGEGNGGSLVRQYQLNYKMSTASSRSLVQSIQASAINPITGATEWLPVTSFDWADGAASPQVVRGAEFIQPNFGNPTPGSPNGYRPPLFLQARLDGTGRISQVGVKMSACGKTGEPNCVGQDVALHATGLLRVRSPDGVETDVTVDFSPLRSTSIPSNLRFASAMVAPGGIEFADVDGDGRDDLVLTDTWDNGMTWGGAPIRWAVCLNSGALGAPLSFTCSPGASFSPTLVELKSDGKMHMVSPFDNQGNGTECSYSKEAAGIVCNPLKLTSDTPLPLALNPYNVYNFFRPQGIRFGRRSMSDLYSVWTAEVPAANPSNPYGTKLYPVPGTLTAQSKPYDLVQGVTICFNRPDGVKCQELARVRSNGKLITALSASVVDDLNGDGLTDFVYVVGAAKEYPNAGLSSTTAQANQAFGISGPGTMFVCLSKETGVDCKVDGKRYAPNADWSDPLGTARSGDFLGDGITRVMFDSVPNSPDKAGAKSELCRYTNTGFVCQDLPYQGRNTGLEPAVINDSGVPVQYVATGNMSNGFPTLAPVSLVAPADQDRMVRVTNGVGYVSEVSYARGDDASTYGRYVPGGSLAMPVYPKMVAMPGVVAKESRFANGKGGWIRAGYYYEGATSDIAGRDAFNFAKFRVTDVANQIAKTSLLALDFPFAGETRDSESVFNGGVSLNKIHVDFNQKVLAFNSGARTYFPFAETTTVARNDLDGSSIGTNTAVDSFDDWGNLQTHSESMTGAGKTFNSVTTTGFDNDETNWLLGLARTVTVTKGATGVPSITRNMAYEYDEKGRLKIERVEPNNPALKVDVTHSRANNSFGLINTSTQTWIDPYTGAAQGRKIKDVEYDVKGRFVLKARDALGHEEVRKYFAGTGALRELTDPNQIMTTWTADAFGRVKVATAPDGTEVRSYAKRCLGNCPLGAASVTISDFFKAADRTAMPVLVYSDSAGHVLRKLTFGFDGRKVDTDFRYDDQGREWQADLPHYSGERAYLLYSKRYDELGRLKEVEGRDDGGNPIFTKNTYRGLSVDIQNAKTKTETQTRDVLGRLVQVNDREGGLTTMGYDAFGNLLSTTDPNRNVVSIEYDSLGRKTVLNDPDLVRVKYDVDPVGRVWKQTSAKQAAINQTAAVKEFTRFEYDHLNRMTGRYETDLESHWLFDTAAYGKGRLSEAYTITKEGAKDYRRLLSYDEKGRESNIKQYIDKGTFSYTPSYDSQGRLAKQSYQRNDDASTLRSFTLYYNGQGYLERVENAAHALWTATAYDAMGQIAGAKLGNNLVESTAYKQYTGRLENHSVRLASGALRVSDNYQYDTLGNVSRREQYWETQQFSEGFGYDNLNRLTSSQIGTALKNYVYDAGGNIRNKTGTGTGDYVYPPQGTGAPHPHAVQSIPGIGNFDYDENGNLKSGGGRSMEWTSFDMPAKISKSATVWSTFTYGPEHQRTIQRRGDGSRIVYAGSQELELTETTTTVKNYWPNGVGVEIVRPNGTVEENWFHKDRLGSVIAISDKNGAIKESLAYDPWGKRRFPDGSGTPDLLDGTTDNKGYTGHEMLDQLDLVHMNGRVFDPLTARFVSADSHVTDAFDGQNYNRYSYVLNNPLYYTDPTGFDPAGPHAEYCEPGTVTISGRNEANMGSAGPSTAPVSMPMRENRVAAGAGTVQSRRSAARNFVIGAAKQIYNDASGFVRLTNPVISTVNDAVGLPKEFEIDEGQGAGAVAGFVVGIALTGGESLGASAAAKAEGLLARTVSLDTNALIAALEKGSVAAVDKSIAGRIPIVSITAVKEFLGGGGSIQALRNFLAERGGRLAAAGTEAEAASLRAQAQQMGRSLGVGDSRVGASAVKEGATVITNDKRFGNFLRAIGIDVIGH